MDGIHDMGGMQGFGPVVTPGSDLVFHEDWERRVFALNLLTGMEGLEGGPGFRATLESMSIERYLASGYYERWLWTIEQGLLAKGTISPGEIDGWMDRLDRGEDAPVASNPDMVSRSRAELHARYPLRAAVHARFAPGDRVRVRRMRPSGHNRCPRYVRGATGTIHRTQGADSLPDQDGEDAPREPVYCVAFASVDLWGDSAEPAWKVLIDLWESYLEPTLEPAEDAHD